MAFDPDAYLSTKIQPGIPPVATGISSQSAGGFDPDAYIGSKFNEIQKTNPDYAANLQADPAFESFMKSIGKSVIPTGGGLLGGIGGAALAGAVTGAEGGLALGPVGSAVAGVAGGLIGGLAGAFLADKAQSSAGKAVFGDKWTEWEKQEALNREAHPYATFAGEVAPSLLAVRPSIKNLKDGYKFGSQLLKLKPEVAKRVISSKAGQAQISNLINIAVGTGTESGREAIKQIQEGDFKPVRLAMAIILGAAQSEPTRIGKAIGMHPTGELTPAIEIAKHLDAIDIAKTADQVYPLGGTENAIRKPSTTKMGAQPVRTEGTGEAGGGGIRPGQQGEEVTGAKTEAQPIPEVKTDVVTDPAEVQRIRNSIQEGELILRSGKFNGRKMDAGELISVLNSVNNSRAKIGMEPFVAEKAATETVVEPEATTAIDKQITDIEGKIAKLKTKLQNGDPDSLEYQNTQMEHDNLEGVLQDLKAETPVQKQTSPAIEATEEARAKIEKTVADIRQRLAEENLADENTVVIKSADEIADLLKQKSATLPKALQGEGKVAGLSVDGKQYIIAENIDSPDMAVRVAKEEKMHTAIDALPQEQWTAAGRQTYKGKWNDIVAEIKGKYGYEEGTPEFNHELIAKAYADDRSGKNPGVWGKLVGYLRQALRRTGIKVGLSDEDVIYLSSKALESRARVPREARATGVRYSIADTLKEKAEGIRKSFKPTEQERFKFTEEDLKDPINAGAKKVQDVLDWSRKRVKDTVEKPLTLKRMREFLQESFIRSNAKFVNRLMESEVRNRGGENLVAEVDAISSAPPRADYQFDQVQKRINEIVSDGEYEKFDNFLNQLRTLAVKEVDPNIKRTGNLGEKEALAYLEKMAIDNPDQYERFTKASKIYNDAMQEELRQAYHEGLLDAERYRSARVLHPFYEPTKFRQYMDPDTLDTGGSKPLNVTDSGLRKLDKGSTDAMMVNSKALMSRLILANRMRIAKNNANKSLLKLINENPAWAKENGISIPEKGMKAIVPAEYDRVTVWENGEPQAILMPHDLAKSWQRSKPFVNNEVIDWIGWLSGAKLVKTFATGAGNPLFAFKNVPIDMMFRWHASDQYDKWLFKAMPEMAQDMKAVWHDVRTGKGRVLDYLNEGGQIYSLTSQGRILPKEWESAPAPIKRQLQKVEEVLTTLNEWSELLGRLAFRERMIKNLTAEGVPLKEAQVRASREAATMPNWGQSGTIGKYLDAAIPYLNAGMQVTAKTVQAAKSNPALFGHKTAQLAALGFGLAFWNKMVNREAWDAVSDREKTNNFIITTPFSFTDRLGRTRHIYLRLKADQTTRIFKQIGQEVAETMLHGTGQEQRINMALGDMSPVDKSSIMPPTMQAFVGYMSNKDFWRNRDIWQGAEVPPEFEFTADTPMPFVKLGEATGLSPERTKRSIESFMPANPFTALMGTFYDAAVPKDKEIHKSVTDKIMNIPGVSIVLRVTRPYELSKREQSQAKTLGIDKNLAPVEIKRQLEEKGLQRSGARQKLNVDADIIIEQVLAKEKSPADFYKWLQTVPDVTERKRLLGRYKEKRGAIRK